MQWSQSPLADGCAAQVDDRVCEGGQEVEISLSRMKDELLEELGSTQVRRTKWQVCTSVLFLAA